MPQRTSRLTSKELGECAAVGIGTMIVFIATVLVAAIAAGVLIDMSGKLQSRSQETGEQSTAQVSSNLLFEFIDGVRNNSGQANLQFLEINVRLAPGAQEVDLAEMLIQLQTTAKSVTYNYSQSTSWRAGEFTASALRDADGSFAAATPSMTSGDLVQINITLAPDGMTLAPRTEVQLRLIPEVGISVQTDLTTPTSYKTGKVVALR